jgi:ABC-2 type transport system ATP-binding protein
MLEAVGLHKRYGPIVAVEDVSLRAERGQTVGLLGPNGAGKTTTVSMICGLLPPDRGKVLIDGCSVTSDTDPIKRRIGLVPQDIALHEEMPAWNNLELFGALYSLSGAALRKAAGAALELAGLTDRAHDKVKVYSGGMKRRLNLAASLLHNPDILLLDEPTVGVDPQSRNAIFSALEELKRQGKTLIYTTHYMEEAERLCDRIIIVDHGKVIANDTLDGVRRLVPAVNVLDIEFGSALPDSAGDGLRALAGVAAVESTGNHLRITVEDLSAVAPRVLDWLAQHGLRYEHVASERAGLESVFLTLTGRSVRD